MNLKIKLFKAKSLIVAPASVLLWEGQGSLKEWGEVWSILGQKVGIFFWFYKSISQPVTSFRVWLNHYITGGRRNAGGVTILAVFLTINDKKVQNIRFDTIYLKLWKKYSPPAYIDSIWWWWWGGSRLARPSVPAGKASSWNRSRWPGTRVVDYTLISHDLRE